MQLSVSGFSSSVIQTYLPAILDCYINRNETIRLDASEVLWRILEQGLVTPVSSIIMDLIF